MKTFPKIIQYKTTSKLPISVLEDLDVVVTSYNEVMKQFPFPDRQGRNEIAKAGYQKWWKRTAEKLGDLHKVSP